MVVSGYCFTRFAGPAAQTVEEQQAALAVYDLNLRGAVGRYGITYIVFGRETCPTSGRKHLQGYFQTSGKNPARINQEFDIVFNKQKATATQAMEYCKKEGDFFEAGRFDETVKGTTEKKPGERTDLSAVYASIHEGKTLEEISDLHFDCFIKYSKSIEQKIRMRDSGKHLSSLKERFEDSVLRPWQQNLLTDLESPVDPRKIIWIWDQTGNSGKSWMATYLAAMHGACPLDYGKKADLAHIFAGMMSRIVVFDLTRKMPEHMDHLYSMAEALKRGWMNTSKYDSRVIHFEPCHVVFFANCPPDYQAWSADRYDVRNID